MKQQNPQRRGSTRRIAGRAQQDDIRDPYQNRQKLAEDTVCPECGAVFHDGRWQWSTAAKNAPQQMCPACRRTADGFPAGVVTLCGPISRSQREDLIGLVRHQEEAEKTEHPLNRIIGIDDDAEGLVITTTDIHLPRRIGEAVKRAFHGALEIDFDENEYFVRVDWTPQP
ncbi:MAG TPA: BCAM0308 family protein [Stellaceae bacterium]|nr:BCAM0308 family protein [Stellaceae bacterium]